MKNMFLLSCTLVAILCFCPAVRAEQAQNVSATGLTIEDADRILEFGNRGQAILAGDYYTLGDVLAAYCQIYREVWRLPKMPPVPESRPSLRAPGGLFTEEEEKKLDVALGGMNAEIEKMRRDYEELEKYVLDDSIHDDGKKGIALCREINLSHRRFMRARSTWRGIVEARAAAAEDQLLADNPLRRQIIAARHIFEQMVEVSDLLRAGNPERQAVTPFRQSIFSLATDAAKPPFQAVPGLERLYRTFLKEVFQYVDILDRALLEGFYAPQKRELGQVMEKCRQAYNLFAQQASGAIAG